MDLNKLTDDLIECEQCGSIHNLFIGILAEKVWWKCRACGWVFTGGKAEEDAGPVEETENEEYLVDGE